eukprot:CAMPEP_0117483878 /NCGR_PEP_ID=MMETSP0784-20121206/14170_1 /TAXON_ID=39447 /ORGANISM="" /LENGTH=54 /DNA_ID=CAMNT_0005278435 /DNA_START=667 /DNA_END=831 /DNA_ORIENTATION=-
MMLCIKVSHTKRFSASVNPSVLTKGRTNDTLERPATNSADANRATGEAFVVGAV